MVLVTELKLNGGKTKFSEAYSCGWVYRQDHSQRVSHLGENLPSQDGFPQSWNTPAFMISYLNPKATTKAILSMNRRQMIVFEEEYGQGSLICPSC